MVMISTKAMEDNDEWIPACAGMTAKAEINLQQRRLDIAGSTDPAGKRLDSDQIKND